MATTLCAAPDPQTTSAHHIAADLDIMQPDRILTLGGRTLTVREYGFFEGLEIADRAEGFLADLVALADDGHLRYAQVRRLFGRHRAVVPAIAAQAANVDVAWLEALLPDELELYLATWFATNAGFFVREVSAEIRERQLRAADPAAGAISSCDWPPPASAISNASDVARSDS